MTHSAIHEYTNTARHVRAEVHENRFNCAVFLMNESDAFSARPIRIYGDNEIDQAIAYAKSLVR